MIGTISSLRGPSYPIPYSLRFRSSASAYLSRTPSAAGNRKTWTWSGWVKIGRIGVAYSALFQGYAGVNDRTNLVFENDVLYFADVKTSSTAVGTSAVFRDTSAWYHIVCSVDTTQTTPSNRCRIYVNGVQQTLTGTQVNKDTLTYVNSNIQHNIGNDAAASGRSFDGYMAEVHFVDGQALTPAAFGDISSATGVWAPKKYTGTYGDNGFYLKFADNSAASATAIGKDSSGNAVPNNWTPTNISMVAGATFDSMTDTPTPYGDAKYYSGWNPSYGLQFRSSASTYLSRTPSVVGDTTTFTWSGWVKRRALGVGLVLFGCTITEGTAYSILNFNAADTLQFTHVFGGVVQWSLGTSQVFRDLSDWYHIVAVADTNNPTAADRLRLYINGVRITSFSSNTTPSPGASSYINSLNLHTIGRYGSSQYFDGVLADINFIDGQALTPAAFAETVDGRWVPKTYTGVYGNNGFYLNFADDSAIGKDSSGKAVPSNWTPNSMAITDAIDYGVKSVRGNYAVWNAVEFNAPNSNNTSVILSNGNLDTTASLGTDGSAANVRYATIGVSSGKWYWEMTCNTVMPVGVTYPQYYVGTQADLEAVQIRAVTNFTTNDIVGFALDADSGKFWWSKNGVWQNGGNPLAGTTPFVTLTDPPYRPGISEFYANGGFNPASKSTTNFGQRLFAYTPPAGFKALCTHNLPAPTIKKAAAYMAATTYTGTGVGRTITNTVNNTSFQPDLVWIKGRSGTTDHALYDSVRGASTELMSNSATAETTQTTGLTAFGANGFDIGALAKLNTNAATYVAWQWKKDAAAGFDIVSYTGTGASRTVAHNLGVEPAMIIVKRSQTGGTGNWQVRHKSIPVANSIQLNVPNQAAAASTVWNNTAPTSSVFSIGTHTDVNASGVDYVAYCFAEIAGYSKFGSYTGNNSNEGPFVFCGFRPKFVMVKRTDVADDWELRDVSRETYNRNTLRLRANLPAAEISTAGLIDFLSNGFKLQNNNTAYNVSGTYIFAAFAEVPSKYALAR